MSIRLFIQHGVYFFHSNRMERKNLKTSDFSKYDPQDLKQQHHQRTCYKCKFLGLTRHLLNQKLWELGPGISCTKPSR